MFGRNVECANRAQPPTARARARPTARASRWLAYDPLGRLATQAGGTTTRLVYDGDDLVAEYNSASTLPRRYLHGPGTDDLLIQYEGTGVTSTVERLLYSDAQGSIIATTDNAGNLMLNGIDKYDEYGIPQTDSSGHSLNSGRFQYTGQQWIPSSACNLSAHR